MKSRLKLLIAFSLAGLQLTAQEKRPITLNEAIDLGIKNSKQLKNSQAKIEEATAALKEALNNQLPDAKLSGSYLWLSSANVDMDAFLYIGLLFLVCIPFVLLVRGKRNKQVKMELH